MSNVFVANIPTQLSSTINPTTGANVLMQHTAVSNTAVPFVTTALYDLTSNVFWKVSGGPVVVTLDGSDPVVSPLHGFIFADGSSGFWSSAMANAANAIRHTSTDAVISIQELTR